MPAPLAPALLPLTVASLCASPAVVVPMDAPVTLVAAPSARAIIPAGAFPMGATAEEIKAAQVMCEDELRSGGALLADLPSRCGSRFEAEGPEGEVFLPTYAIDRTEVTTAAYAACVKARACRPGLDLPLQGDPRRPVERVTWDEAVVYCRFRGGRLPSEAEWEKAARGPARRIFPWGDRFRARRANHGRAERLGPPVGPGGEEPTDAADGYGEAAPVGSFPAGASPYELLDLAGNLWEWTSGHFAREPPQTGGRIAPLGPMTGSERTIRGGSYRSPPSDLRVTRRVGLPPGDRHPGVGFRCVYRVAEAAPR